MAEFFDISTRVFADWLTAGAPRLEVGPRKFLYDLKAISAWRSQREAARVLEDPDIEGTNSENLEKIRYHKARIAKVEADKAEGLVVDRQLARSCFGRFADIMRRLGETLKRLNPEAHELLNESLLEAREMIEPLVWVEDGNGPNHEEDESSPAA